MSFKKQQPYQLDIQAPLLPSRSEKYLYDSKASHNLFYRNVYSNVHESVFAPLYCTGNGHPDSSVRRLVTLRIYKDH